MNFKKYLIALSISLLISTSILHTAPFAYVTTAAGHDINVIDVATNTVTATIPVAGSSSLVDIVIAPNNLLAYALDESANRVFIINLATNTVVTGPGLPIPTGGSSPKSIAITPDEKYLIVPGDNNINYTLIDTTTNTPTTHSLVGHGIANANYVAISPDGRNAYITDGTGFTGNIVILDLTVLPATPTVTSFTVAAGELLSGIAIAPNDNTTGYVCDDLSNRVYKLTGLPSAPVTGSFASGGELNFPQAIVISPNGSTAYVANTGGSSVSVITTSTMTRGTPIATGSTPENLALTSDGKFLYIPDNGSSNVIAFNTTTNLPAPGSPISVDSQPTAVAIIPSIPPLPPSPSSTTGSITTQVINGQTVQVLTITWAASSSSGVVSYNIYNGNTLVGNVLAIPPSGPFSFTIVLAPGDNGQNFSVAAVNSNGQISAHTPVTVPLGPIAGTAVGLRRNNVFLDKTERILIISWIASSSANIVSYNIYNGTTLVDNVLATAPLTFTTLLTKGDNGQNFSIIAVTSNGSQSASIAVIVR